MTSEEARLKIHSEADFIYLPRFENSINKLLRRYSGGPVPDRIIAQALLITEDEVQSLYEIIVIKLRTGMGVEALDQEQDSL